MTKVLEFWAVEKNIINENFVYIGRAGLSRPILKLLNFPERS